jgi:hypothetical protein
VLKDTIGDHVANPRTHDVFVCLNEQVRGSNVKSLGCRIHDIQFVLKVFVLRVSVSASHTHTNTHTHTHTHAY